MNLGLSVFDVLAWKDFRKQFYFPFFTTKLRPSVETPDLCAVEWSTNLNTFSARYFFCFSCLFHFWYAYGRIIDFRISFISKPSQSQLKCWSIYIVAPPHIHHLPSPFQTLVKNMFLNFSSYKKIYVFLLDVSFLFFSGNLFPHFSLAMLQLSVLTPGCIHPPGIYFSCLNIFSIFVEILHRQFLLSKFT